MTTENVALQSRGAARSFYLALPADLRNDETLPVIFLWHWLGGSARSFFERGEIQAAVDSQRFIAVMPEKKGDLAFTWPYSLIDGAARMEEEFAFFDDMLSCVSEQFNVDANCVSSAGVSAGALFTAQLAGFRGDYLASFISLSGGVGGVIKPWTQPEHRMPALVLNGGPTDNCLNLLNFQQQSRVLEDALTSGGHFLVECVHNCGHAVPPFEGEAGFSKFQFLWDFAMDHPFWLPAGRSVYESTGLPSATPDWCGIGRGGATPRTGECTDSSEC